jgi:ATP-dependent RNA helicase RhlE
MEEAIKEEVLLSQFDLHPDLSEGLISMGFSKATPIQRMAIPEILKGKDLVACAQTGTGKTGAFLIPLLHRLSHSSGSGLRALIVVPTRELAIQIDQNLQAMAYFTNISGLAIYGGGSGVSFEQEKKALSGGADIVVATPGRLISHLNLGYVQADSVEVLVLDEADRMLDMGFLDDITKIIKYLPSKRQTLLFSATMPPKIRELGAKYLHQPVEISLAVSKPAEGVDQRIFYVFENQKTALLKHILSVHSFQSMILFSSSKEKVKQLGKDLRQLNMVVGVIHSDLDQDQRNEVMTAFRARRVQLLVATDILSRGIDIDSIGMVINYDVPHDAEDYVHRVGRTARAESKGMAVTFVTPADFPKISRIQKLIERDIPVGEVPEALGETPSPLTHAPAPRRKPKFGKGKPRHGKPAHGRESKN